MVSRSVRAFGLETAKPRAARRRRLKVRTITAADAITVRGEQRVAATDERSIRVEIGLVEVAGLDCAGQLALGSAELHTCEAYRLERNQRGSC
jgi:hypothetical protein